MYLVLSLLVVGFLADHLLNDDKVVVYIKDKIVVLLSKERVE